MSEFKQYRRRQIAELRPYVPGENLTEQRVSISAEDAAAGSPKAGDMVARNPKNHADQWLVADALDKLHWLGTIIEDLTRRHGADWATVFTALYGGK